MGLLLAAVAVQFLLNGIQAFHLQMISPQGMWFWQSAPH